MIPPPPPFTPTADQARELAARELAGAAYRAREPGLLERVGQWLLDRLGDLVTLLTTDRLEGAGGVVLVVVLLAVVVAVVRWRLGRSARTARLAPAPLDDTGASAAEHRARAGEYAASGEFDDAVREWMRALVRDLEERDVLAPRAGRTAGEAAREAAAVLPAAGDAVADAARCFDETVYGGRPADAGSVDRMRAADEAVRRVPVTSG